MDDHHTRPTYDTSTTQSSAKLTPRHDPLTFTVPRASSVPQPHPRSTIGTDRQPGSLPSRPRPCPSLGQKASSHCQWWIHASAFVNHWTSGTLSLQGGQVAECRRGSMWKCLYRSHVTLTHPSQPGLTLSCRAVPEQW